MSRATGRKVENERKRGEVVRLYMEGWSQQEIASHRGVSQQAVSKMIATSRATWHREALEDVGLMVAEELQRIRSVERQAWESWRKSLAASEVTTTERISAEMQGVDGQVAPDRIKAVMRREAQCGDPRFLQTILNCIDRRSKLLGLDAPVKVDTHLKGRLEVRTTDELTDEELEAIANGDPAQTPRPWVKPRTPSSEAQTVREIELADETA